MTFGTVTSVEARDLGSELVTFATSGATVLEVDMVSDFDEEGGSLILNGGTLVYTSVDPELETITLAEPLTLAADADDFVQVVEAGAPAVEWVAQVALDEGDTISALIPTTLIPYFPEGTYDEPVQVEIRERNGDYEVTKQPNTEPSFDGGTVWNPRLKRSAVLMSVPHDAWTPIVEWNDVEAAGIDAVGSDNTIRYPGSYLVLARLTWPVNGTGRRGVRIVFNGVAVEHDIRGAEPTGLTYVRIFDSIQAAEFDTVSIEAYQSSGAALNMNGGAVTIFRISS